MNDTMNTTNTNAGLDPQDASYDMAFVSSNEYYYEQLTETEHEELCAWIDSTNN